LNKKAVVLSGLAMFIGIERIKKATREGLPDWLRDCSPR